MNSSTRILAPEVTLVRGDELERSHINAHIDYERPATPVAAYDDAPAAAEPEEEKEPGLTRTMSMMRR
jgi:hypothetical protein